MSLDCSRGSFRRGAEQRVCCDCVCEREKERENPYSVGGFVALEADLAHVNDNRASTLDDIAVDCRTILEQLVCGKAALVDDFHLLDDSALTRLS